MPKPKPSPPIPPAYRRRLRRDACETLRQLDWPINRIALALGISERVVQLHLKAARERREALERIKAEGPRRWED